MPGAYCQLYSKPEFKPHGNAYGEAHGNAEFQPDTFIYPYAYGHLQPQLHGDSDAKFFSNN